MISRNTIGRLSLYRRLLKDVLASNEEGHIFSHDLASLAGASAAQVRRDMMTIGHSGSPARGYDVRQLIEEISAFLDAPTVQRYALVGVGNLGRALLAYFGNRGSHFSIAAAFDTREDRTNRVINGCRCYPAEEMPAVLEREGIRLAIVAVPAEGAQEVTNELVRAGVTGLVNFAPVRLWTPDGVYVEDVDLTMSLERAAYYARAGDASKGG